MRSDGDTEHPLDLIPGFVLDALDADEALQVAKHIQHCPSCCAEAESFRSTLSLLPYTTRIHDPPPHVKRQLFARIAATHKHMPLSHRSHAARPAPRWQRWAVALAALSLAINLVLVAVTIRTQNQLTQTIIQIEQRQADQQQVAEILSAPDVVRQPLQAQAPGVEGTVFMRPAQDQMVLVIHGLAATPPSTTYQFWFATADQQVPARTFDIGPDGTTQLLIKAPAVVDSYTQVMITVEQHGGSAIPSNTVVLVSSL